MIAAALGDIHGNLPALNAALREIDEAGILTVLCTGDLVAGAEWPNEAVERVSARGMVCVQGEADRLTVRFLRKQSSLADRLPREEFDKLQEAFDRLSSRNIEFLRGLPKTAMIAIEGIEIVVCHGTLSTQAEALDLEGGIEILRRQREQCTAPIIVCGRSHRASYRWVDGTLFVNPGAVGMTPHRAAYALIDTESDPWHVELREAAY